MNKKIAFTVIAKQQKIVDEAKELYRQFTTLKNELNDFDINERIKRR